MIQNYLTAILCLFLSLKTFGQTTNQEASKRVLNAPESVYKKFRDAGMNPVNHELTENERAKVEKAFSFLPPLHQKILKANLHSISFMDNMPNTALTSTLENQGGVKMFNITFRAGIFNETISEWATAKELICYDRSTNPDYEVRIEAGEMDAFLYVLLHEATHVVDAVLELTPHPFDKDTLIEPTAFTESIWYKMNIPAEKYIDPLLEKTRFRGGSPLSIETAPEIYGKLQKTPFPSLYAMASWFEDIAELETIYHLTQKMNQPFYITVRKNNTEIFHFEPLKNDLVKSRLKQLTVFYEV